MSCFLLREKRSRPISAHTDVDTHTHATQPTHVHRCARLHCHTACRQSLCGVGTHAFLQVHRQTCACRHTHTLTVKSLNVSHSLIFNRRPVSVYFLLKITLQAIAFYSSVPPQDVHCFHLFHYGPSDITPRAATFQEIFHICTAFSRCMSFCKADYVKGWSGDSWN